MKAEENKKELLGGTFYELNIPRKNIFDPFNETRSLFANLGIKVRLLMNK